MRTSTTLQNVLIGMTLAPVILFSGYTAYHQKKSAAHKTVIESPIAAVMESVTSSGTKHDGGYALTRGECVANYTDNNEPGPSSRDRLQIICEGKTAVDVTIENRLGFTKIHDNCSGDEWTDSIQASYALQRFY